MSETALQKAVLFLQTAETFLLNRRNFRHAFHDPEDVSSEDQDWILSWFLATQRAWQQLDLAKLEDSIMILQVSDMVANLPPIVFEREESNLPTLKQLVYTW